MTFEYQAELLRVVDGDTYWLRVWKDLVFGFGLAESKTFEGKFRLADFNCPETSGPSRERGLLAKAEAARLLGAGISRVVSRNKMHGDRWLADVYVLVDGTERSLGEVLFERGFAQVYP